MAKFKVIKPFELEGRSYGIGEIVDEADFPAGSRNWLKTKGHTVPATLEEALETEPQT